MLSLIIGMDVGAMRANKLITGENGDQEFAPTDDMLMDLFFKLRRGMDLDDLEGRVHEGCVNWE